MFEDILDDVLLEKMQVIGPTSRISSIYNVTRLAFSTQDAMKKLVAYIMPCVCSLSFFFLSQRERVGDRLPLMTYGLKLSLEFLNLKKNHSNI